MHYHFTKISRALRFSANHMQFLFILMFVSLLRRRSEDRGDGCSVRKNQKIKNPYDKLSTLDRYEAEYRFSGRKANDAGKKSVRKLITTKLTTQSDLVWGWLFSSWTRIRKFCMINWVKWVDKCQFPDFWGCNSLYELIKCQKTHYRNDRFSQQ